MKDKCIEAVADAIGRDITKQEAQGIEDRIVKNMRFEASKDPEAFRLMSADERLSNAAMLAAKELIAESELKKRRVVLTIQAHDRIEGFINQAKAAGMEGSMRSSARWSSWPTANRTPCRWRAAAEPCATMPCASSSTPSRRSTRASGACSRALRASRP